MNRSRSLTTVALLFLFLTVSAAASDKPRESYALHLEARPSAPFPFLDKLGRVQIAVYPEGVRADSRWLGGFVRAGDDTVRIENPALRLYTDSSLDTLRRFFVSLSPEKESMALGELEVRKTGRTGTIKKLPASCYRIILGETAWIDVWTTQAVRSSRPYQILQSQLLAAVSPDLEKAARRIPGTPLHVVLNTRRFPDTVLLTTREVYFSSAGNEDALQTGRFFLKAPSLDRLVK